MPSRNRTFSLFRGLVVTALVLVFAIVIGITGYVTPWIMRGGSHVFIPWISSPAPGPINKTLSRLRTRDLSGLHRREPCSCALVFFHIGPDSDPGTWAIDALGGFNGLSHVTVDCCLESGGEPWLINSGTGESLSGMIDGPYSAPLQTWGGRDSARGNIAGLLDCQKFFTDLRSLVENQKIHHKTPDYVLSFLAGRDEEDVVTCSGLIGRCILKQPASKMAELLRQALQQRVTYGEITPNDLARALAVGRVPEERHPELRFRTGPVGDAIRGRMAAR